MAIRLVCSECKKKFRWADEDDWPKCCPMCGTDMSLPDDNVISMPALRSAVMNVHDKLYRDMEKGSEYRVQLASEALGVPTSELSHLKITNMRDNTREGEIAAIEDASVRQAANRLGLKSPEDAFKGGGGQDGAGAFYGPGIASGEVTVNGQTVRGIEPRAGATAMNKIQRAFGG